MSAVRGQWEKNGHLIPPSLLISGAEISVSPQARVPESIYMPVPTSWFDGLLRDSSNSSALEPATSMGQRKPQCPEKLLLRDISESWQLEIRSETYPLVTHSSTVQIKPTTLPSFTVIAQM